MEKINVSASIVLYKQEIGKVEKTIRSFFNTKLKVKLFLIDNSPTKDLMSLVSLNKNIVYISYCTNLGFGVAHNLAIGEIKEFSQYHLILNPDIYYDEGVLESLYDFMEKNGDIGNVMPKVLYENGKLQRLCKLLPTPINLFGRRFINMAKIKNKLNDDYELKNYKYDKVIEIPNLSGCFMFIRNTILQQLGGFDERYFMYMEDVDLNRRIFAISRTVCYPFVFIKHSFKKQSYYDVKLLKIHIQSAIKYFNKWGWFVDTERKIVNSRILGQLKK